MKGKHRPKSRIEVCSDCESLSRRRFLHNLGGTFVAGTAGAALGGLALPSMPSTRVAHAEKTAKNAESYVKLLYESLTNKQRKLMLFPFDHELRKKISNNWHIVDDKVASVGRLYTFDQTEMIRQILKDIFTEDGFDRVSKQMEDDAGGLDNYTCAIFGAPGDDKFEWVMTGRHLTIRADGNSVDNVALGGPIFYGHAVKFTERPDHPGNVWWHQARAANKVFEALDGKQREKALLKESPPDEPETVALVGSKGKIPGLAGHEMSADQKGLLEATLRSMLNMFRKSDVDEILECLKKNGGVDQLRVSFYQQGDLGSDGIWDRWIVAGPAFVWYFRGSPHVHAWLNVGHHGAGDQPL